MRAALGRFLGVQGDFGRVRASGNAHRNPHFAGVRRFRQIGVQFPRPFGAFLLGRQRFFEAEFHGVVYGSGKSVGAAQPQRKRVVVHGHGRHGDRLVRNGEGVAQGAELQIFQGLGVCVAGQGLQRGVALELAVGEGEVHHGLQGSGVQGSFFVEPGGAHHGQVGLAVQLVCREVRLPKVFKFPQQSTEPHALGLGVQVQFRERSLGHPGEGARHGTFCGGKRNLVGVQAVSGGPNPAAGAEGLDAPVGDLVGPKLHPVVPRGGGFGGRPFRLLGLPNLPRQHVFHPQVAGTEVQVQKEGVRAAPIHRAVGRAGEGKIGSAYAESAFVQVCVRAAEG